jgi:hypothetical protein
MGLLKKYVIVLIVDLATVTFMRGKLTSYL